MNHVAHRFGWIIGLAAALLVAGSNGHAAGPLYVARDGRPYVWDRSRPIRYVVDPGPLGRYSNADATRWVAEQLARWASVEGVGLTFQASAHPRDVTGRNVLAELRGLPEDVSLVIFDHDGSVTDELLGFGASDEVQGFGGARRFDSRTATIRQGRVVLNGKFSRELTPEGMQELMLHELGHFLGLAHSQLNPHVQWDGDPTNDGLAPVMSYNRGPNARPELHLEDRAWFSRLYPPTGGSTATGTIRGRVLFPDGRTGLQGVQVVARRDGDEEATAVSGVSGFLYRNGLGGSPDVALQGAFELPALPPGTYRLAIEQLEDRPIVFGTHAFLPGGRRFWREGEGLSAQPRDATLVAVTAGGVVAGRDFLLDGPAPAVRTVVEREPNDSPEQAVTLSLPAVATGRAGPQDAGLWSFPFFDEVDFVEDWYRIVVMEPTTLSVTLAAATSSADLDLYLVSDLGGDIPWWGLIEADSTDGGTPPETIQTRVPVGIYYLGISSFDDDENTPSDYRLEVTSVPSPDLPTASNSPRIDLAIVSHLTSTGMRVRWQTDQDASAVLHIKPLGEPKREWGRSTPAREHALDVSGVTPGAEHQLQLFSRGADGDPAALPDLWVRVPRAPSGESLFVSGGLWSAIRQDEKGEEFLLVARVYNWGRGQAANVQILGLTLATGWRFVTPPTLPLDLGPMGPLGTSVIVMRVVRTSSGAAPLDLIMEGNYTTLAGAVRTFNR